MLTSLQKKDFSKVSIDIGRTANACHRHYKVQLLPILKSDILALPQDLEWTKNFCHYIVHHRITNVKQISYNQVVKEVCPGQTTESISQFANDLIKESKGGKTVSSTDPLYELSAKKLNTPDISSYLGNGERANSKLAYIKNILKMRNEILQGS